MFNKSIWIKVDPVQLGVLNQIVGMKKISRSALIREAIELVLEKYSKDEAPQLDIDGTIAAQTGCD